MSREADLVEALRNISAIPEEEWAKWDSKGTTDASVAYYRAKDALYRAAKIAAEALAQPPLAKVVPDTVDFVRDWMMSGDHDVSDWERQFAAAIDDRSALARYRASAEGGAKSEWTFGREHERELIAKWLRAQNDDRYPPPDDFSRGAWNAFSGAATAIERCDHIAQEPRP